MSNPDTIPILGTTPDIQGPEALLLTGDVIRTLTPRKIAAIGDFANSMFGVEVRPVHAVEHELGRKARDCVASDGTESSAVLQVSAEVAPHLEDSGEISISLSGPQQRAAEARRRGAETQRRRSREKILKAATSLFAERGWTETTMDDVIKSAGVSSRTVYNRFGSKQTLMGWVYRRLFEPLAAAVDEALQQGDPRSTLDTYIAELARFVRSNQSLTRSLMIALQEQAMKADEVASEEDIRALVPLSQPLRKIIQADQDQGALSGDYPAEQIASHHTNALILTVLTRPDEPAEDLARFALSQLRND